MHLKSESKFLNTLLALASAFVVFGITGCSDVEKSSRSDKKVVVTSFTIIADIAREVAGDAAVVESITKPGVEVHGYDPSPRDIVKVQNADLVLWNGMNLELWFEKFFSNLKNIPSVVVSEGIEPIDIVGGSYSGKPNPHAWMSSSNGLKYVENIRKALVAIDPDNEKTYNVNAAMYSAKIQAIDQPLREQLASIPQEQRWLVTSEGAFSYLCKNYQLDELSLWPINADAQGTPQQVRRVIDKVRKHKIPVVFTESTVSDKAMRQVAKETGARFGGVLYVDSLTGADGPVPSYLKLLEINALTIKKGFAIPK